MTAGADGADDARAIPRAAVTGLVPRVTAYPKVQWLLTRYPVRRWRAIRRWPPVIMLGVFGPRRRLFWVYPPAGDRPR